MMLPCGTPSDIAEGNRISTALFEAHVRRWDKLTPAPAAMPPMFSSAAAFGAVGDGHADDTDALQHALDDGIRVWLEPEKNYRIQRRLVMGHKRQLLSNGTATIVLASGDTGFSNVSWAQDDTGIFSSKGTGLSVRGESVRLEHFFLVKEYEDGRYVIGIEVVHPASNVLINSLRLRGFSIAPGIISVKSVRGITIQNSIVHAAYVESENGMWIFVDGKKKKNGRYQITGIVIDDQQPTGSSHNVVIENNVIMDLWMRPAKTDGRGDQSDGINVNECRVDAPNNVVLRHNYITRVAEGIDTFGKNVRIEDNWLSAREIAIKLIHGASKTTIQRNVIGGKMSICAIGVASSALQVNDILIESNYIENSPRGKAPCISIDQRKEDDGYVVYPPMNVVVRNNRFLMNDPSDTAITGPGSVEENNEHLHEGVFPKPERPRS